MRESGAPSGRNRSQLPPIHNIRRQRVMLDSDLARLYGVTTSRLNEAVKRNADRFPADFRFQLTREESLRLISQIAISSSEGTDNQSDAPNSSQIAMSSRKHRGAAYLPWAFTEHGALMAATVLKSSRAVQMSLFVVRAFVQMREELQAHATVFKRLVEIDKKLVTHDVILRDVYEKLRPLLNPPEKPTKELGFHTLLKKPKR
ncbi:ORF6N domain-containing protein [Opitutus sp. GAS368]|nr:ORF6N domain-containing protein [Opitutus sp. GAS368]